MKNEKWDDVHGNTTPDDRMVAFLESPTDSYAILQLREREIWSGRISFAKRQRDMVCRCLVE